MAERARQGRDRGAPRRLGGAGDAPAQASNRWATRSALTPVASTAPSGRSAGSLEIRRGSRVELVGRTPVGAADQAGVEPDHVHQVPHPERLLREAPADPEPRPSQRRVEEQLGRVVAGLPVDVDGACEVRRGGVVQPVVVGEPPVGAGDRHQLARARMVEPGGPLALPVPAPARPRPRPPPARPGRAARSGRRTRPGSPTRPGGRPQRRARSRACGRRTSAP